MMMTFDRKTSTVPLSLAKTSMALGTLMARDRRSATPQSPANGRIEEIGNDKTSSPTPRTERVDAELHLSSSPEWKLPKFDGDTLSLLAIAGEISARDDKEANERLPKRTRTSNRK